MITKYYKVYGDNGFCGCDTERCVEVNANSEKESIEIIEGYCEDYWEEYRDYFADGRFIDYPDRDEYEDDDAYEEACEEAVAEYESNVSVNYCEMSKEEFLKAVQDDCEYETIGIAN